MGSMNEPSRTWSEICSSRDYHGRWVALDGVRYDDSTTRPAEGTVIDADSDLADLCARLRSANRRCCAILRCDESAVAPPAPMSRTPRGAMAH